MEITSLSDLSILETFFFVAKEQKKCAPFLYLRMCDHNCKRFLAGELNLFVLCFVASSENEIKSRNVCRKVYGKNTLLL